MIRPRLLLVAALGLVLGGCDTLPLAGPHETITRNLVYARHGGKDLHLDLYVPKAARPAPVVVWLHGGAWKYGDKSFVIRVRRLTEAGFAVASVQYRRSWESPWPAQHEDCQAALRWLRANGAAHGIDGLRMGLCGDSSGGHIAALLGLEQGKTRVRAVCTLYPPTDLPLLAERYARFERTSLITQLFGGTMEEKGSIAREASPVNHVGASAPPFLLMHGGRDIIVPVAQSQALHRRLCEAGVESELIVYPSLPHGFGLEDGRLAKVAAFFRDKL